jgi:tetratricopeptide (TPR) repeat protein
MTPIEHVQRLLQLNEKINDVSSLEEAADLTGRLIEETAAFTARPDRQAGIEYLRSLVRDTARDPAEREAALYLLGDLRVPGVSVQAMAESLDDPDTTIRRVAIQRLALLDSSEVAPLLPRFDAMLATVAGSGSPVEKALRKAIRKHRPVDAWRSAGERFDLLAQEPASAADFAALGRHLRQLEDFDRARFEGTLSAFREAVRRDPDLPAARLGLADALASRDELEEAIEEFERLLVLQPDSREGAAGLQRSQMRLQAKASDLEMKRQRATEAPSDPGAQMAFVSMCGAMRRWEDCLIAAERAVVLSPEDPNAHFAIGMALVSLGREPEAMAHFARSIALGGGQGLLEVVPDPDPVSRVYRKARSIAYPLYP